MLMICSILASYARAYSHRKKGQLCSLDMRENTAQPNPKGVVAG